MRSSVLKPARRTASKPRLVIFYASVTGNTAKYAAEIRKVASKGFQVALHNMGDFDIDTFSSSIAAADLVIIMSSTHGSGDTILATALC